MFRDLKEYQEIAKIYAEKVSKPEDLDENRNTRGSEPVSYTHLTLPTKA